MSELFFSLDEEEQQRILYYFWNYVRDDECGCMLWEGFKENGYGRFTFHYREKNHHLQSHRFSLELSVGRVLKEEKDAAHSCRNRHCVNPKHLKEKSRFENCAIDKYRDGINTVKLTPEKALEIYNAKGTHKRIAEKYNIHKSTVSDIKRGRTWSEITKHNK